MSTTRPPAYDQASAPVEASRRGAHRARAKPVLAGLPILAGILIVLGAVGGTWYVLQGDGTKDQSSQSVEAAVPDDDPTGTAPASAGPSAAATGSTQTTQTPSATDTGTDSGAGQVDHSISIRVLNSVRVQGLAKRVASDLEPDGWTVSGTGNSMKKNLSVTKVYYGKKADRTTAQALVKDLGFGTVVPDPSVAKDGLVVVLGQDAAG